MEATKKKEEPDRTVLCALLQFHSERAIAHASFLVATIFGLFTILSLMNTGSVSQFLEIVISLTITYWLVWFFGLYSLWNFNYYASAAQVFKDAIKKDTTLESDILDEAKKKQESKFFFDLKRGGFEYVGKREYALLLLRELKYSMRNSLYFLLIGLVPFLSVNRPLLAKYDVAILIPLVLLVTAIYAILNVIYQAYKVSRRRKSGGAIK